MKAKLKPVFKKQFLTRVPKNTYPVRPDEHTLSEYCTCSNITALQLLVFCTAHPCLASLSSLMEAEPEISSTAHVRVNSNEEV